MSLNSVRENINIRLYSSKPQVMKFLQLLSLMISILALGVMIIYWGFPLSPDHQMLSLRIIKGAFAFYILHYSVLFIYDFSPTNFFKRTWFQAFLFILLIIEGAGDIFFDRLLFESFFDSVGLSRFPALSAVFIQIYLLIIVVVEIGTTSEFIPKVKLHPSSIFILSYVMLCLGGAGLLLLPEMSTLPEGMTFIDALFTSVSATCVTGLSVVNTATAFTFKGQFVIMCLMKLGGLNIVSFAFSQALLSKLGVGVKHHSVIEDFIQKDSVINTTRLLAKIFVLSLMFEIAGSILIFTSLGNQIAFPSLGDKVFFSIFHAISAFNNAGFSIFNDGLFNDQLRVMYWLQLIIIFLVFFGSLGFATIFDLFGYRARKDRRNFPWKKPSPSSRMAASTHIILLVFGAVVFFGIEMANSTEIAEWFPRIVTSLFQSASCRTAGFNTVDINSLQAAIIMLFLFLMLVGGCSSSTAGGIKTSTFAVIILSVYSTIRGKKNVEIYKRTVPNEDLLKAYAVFVFALGGIFTGIFLLNISESNILATEGRGPIDLIFECVSAFATCGLSTGITAMLTTYGKAIIISMMFIGRIGTLTVAYALSKNIKSSNYRYPEEHFLVG